MSNVAVKGEKQMSKRGKDFTRVRRRNVLRTAFAHGHVALSTVEVLALGDGEEPASDGSFLGDVEPLEPDVAVPAVFGQLLAWFGRQLGHKRHCSIC